MSKDIWNIDCAVWQVYRTQVQLWYNRFKEGREDVNDDARPGRPSTSKTNENIKAVTNMILGNRRIKLYKVQSKSFRKPPLRPSLFFDHFLISSLQ